MVEYLCLAHQVNMTELKKKCMDWIWMYVHWDDIKEEKEVTELNRDECRQMMWELMNYGFSNDKSTLKF